MIRIASTLVPVLLAALVSTCGSAATQPGKLLAGTGLDQDTHRLAETRSAFLAGERFALVLTGIKLADAYVDLTVYSIANDGKETRARTQQFKVDPALTFLQADGYAIPFPGKFRIAFEQLGKELGSVQVSIKAP